jgi:hypothetical protein
MAPSSKIHNFQDFTMSIVVVHTFEESIQERLHCEIYQEHTCNPTIRDNLGREFHSKFVFHL